MCIHIWSIAMILAERIYAWSIGFKGSTNNVLNKRVCFHYFARPLFIDDDRRESPIARRIEEIKSSSNGCAWFPAVGRQMATRAARSSDRSYQNDDYFLDGFRRAIVEQQAGAYYFGESFARDRPVSPWDSRSAGNSVTRRSYAELSVVFFSFYRGYFKSTNDQRGATVRRCQALSTGFVLI